MAPARHLIRRRFMIKKTIVALSVATLATGAAVLPGAAAKAADTSVQIASCNPCAAKKCNPCAAKACNPCAAKACNPCAAKGCNPCAAKGCNPCAAKACNPCNPCKPKAN